jgi:hypothetical protein
MVALLADMTRGCNARDSVSDDDDVLHFDFKVG